MSLKFIQCAFWKREKYTSQSHRKYILLQATRSSINKIDSLVKNWYSFIINSIICYLPKMWEEAVFIFFVAVSLKNFLGILPLQHLLQGSEVFLPHGVSRRIRVLWKIAFKVTFIAVRTVSTGNSSNSSWSCNSLICVIAHQNLAVSWSSRVSSEGRLCKNPINW